MDRTLDEIIGERPRSSNHGRNRQSAGRRRGRDEARVHKSFRNDRADVDRDWVHDKFEDDRDTHPASFRDHRSRRDGRLSPPTDSTGSKLRVNNLHYDITESDLQELFTRIGPINSLSLIYDRAGRSEGIAFVEYKRYADAQRAVREFHGANAKGQPIRVAAVQDNDRPARRNPFDTAEKPKGSLFERAERPRRDSRSLSPMGDDNTGRGFHRRSDVSKPPPDGIDRYIPGQRSPRRGGRNRGRRPADNRNRNDGRRSRNNSGRPKKTQEELDQEMEDYWGNTGAAAQGSATNGDNKAAAEPAAPNGGGDDDIDMIQ